MYQDFCVMVDGSFVNLKTMFSNNGRSTRNNQRVFDQARKAMFSVLRKLQLPVDIQLQMFDTMVLPISIYGIEVTVLRTITCLKGYAKS